MSWQGYHTLDPNLIESFYSNEDSMAEVDSVFEELGEEDELLLDRVKDIMQFLPPREADFIELYFFKKFKQVDIAKFFGVSQPTICYRLNRAATRIKFLLSLPLVTEEEMEKELSLFFEDPLDRELLKIMYKVSCQSVVAEMLNISQGKVRHRFLRSIKKIKQTLEEKTLSEEILELAQKYKNIFVPISQNFNVLREVKRKKTNDLGEQVSQEEFFYIIF